MRALVLATVVLAAGSLGAQAADLVLAEDEPMAVSAPSASGLYIGLFGGYGGASLAGVVDTSEGDPEESEIFSDDYSTGFIYGALIGYSMQSGDWVYGVEADIGGGQIGAYTEDNGANDWATHDINWIATVRGRAGMEIAPGTQLYGTAGVAIANSTFTAFNDNESEVGSADLTSFGLVAGLGVEQSVSDQISVRLEGLYFSPMNKHEFSENELTSDMDDGDFAQVDGMFQIRAGVLFHF